MILMSVEDAAIKESIMEQLKDFHASDRAEIINQARAHYAEEGSIEIDDDAILSRSEEGDYVQAWVWIGKED